MISRRQGALAVAGAVIALMVVAALVEFGLTARSPDAQSPKGIGGPFTLQTHDGRTLGDQDFRGKWLLVYFGYTHCPDICPTTLADIAETLDQLGTIAADIQPLFITIDPERDTPDALRAFVKEFDSRIIGLTGTPTEIALVAKEYRVYYAKKKTADGDNEAYWMDHSAFVYVIGPNGQYMTLFSPLQGQEPHEMAARLRKLVMETSRR